MKCKGFVSLALLCSGLFCAPAFANDAQTLLNEGKTSEAIRTFEAEVSASDPVDVVAAASGLAQIYLAQKYYLQAVKHISMAEEKLSSLPKDHAWYVIVPYIRYTIESALGNEEAALDNIKLAQSQLQHANVSQRWYGAVLYHYSKAIASGEERRARSALSDATDAFEKANDFIGVGMSSLLMADLEFQRGKERRAFAELRSAQEAFKKGRAEKFLALVDLQEADYHIRNGSYAAAKQSLAAARKILDLENIPEWERRYAEIQALVPVEP